MSGRQWVLRGTFGDVDIRLDAGLDPSDCDTDSGWRGRLFNLGFLWDGSAEEDDDELRIALQDFQAAYGLDVTGQFDDASKSKLAQVYGS